MLMKILEFQLVYKWLGPDSSSVMTGFVLVSFSGRVLVVQEVLRTAIIAPYRKAILVLCRFCNMGNITMPEVEQATHLGIIRTTTMKHMQKNIQTNVDENITKAKRSAYSLFGCGFHEHNGLDPESLLHSGLLHFSLFVIHIPRGSQSQEPC
jgi:hypothetical protein